MKGRDTRLAHLDGLRGIAVFIVLFYHFFERWPGFYPYGSALVSPYLGLTGLAGVWLFFVISGFVITLTLHRCASFAEFAVRRFARLWPPMLLCAALSYTALSVIPGSPFQVSARNFLPSLTFIAPYFYNKLFHGMSFDWMDGAYWSLFVEIQFYVLISIIYFLDPRRFARNFLILAALVMMTMPAQFLGIRWLETAVSTSKLPGCLPFFVIGVGCYREHVGRPAGSFFALGLFGVVLLAVTTAGGVATIETVIAGTSALVAAWLGIGTAAGRRLLSARWIASIGIASYSLYLLHQRIGVAAIHDLGKLTHLHGLSSIPLTFVVAAALVLTSMVIYRYWEAPLNRLIVALLVTARRAEEQPPTVSVETARRAA